MPRNSSDGALKARHDMFAMNHQMRQLGHGRQSNSPLYRNPNDHYDEVRIEFRALQHSSERTHTTPGAEPALNIRTPSRSHPQALRRRPVKSRSALSL